MKNLALFIDLENLNDKKIKFDINVLVEIIKEYFKEYRINIAKAYYEMRGEINRSGFKFKLYESGIEPVYSPNFGEDNESKKGKSLSDPILICDAMEILYENPNIDAYVIVSSDKDFLPLIKKIVGKGKEVLVIGMKKDTSDFFINACNSLNVRFVDYEEMFINKTQNII